MTMSAPREALSSIGNSLAAGPHQSYDRGELLGIDGRPTRQAADAPVLLTPVRDADRAEASEWPDLVPRARSETLNRAVNVAIAAVLLALVAPLLVLVAIAIKMTSPGPIFYMQIRVGLDRRRRRMVVPELYDRRAQDLGGRVFLIYKFRTMRMDAETAGAVWATRSDPRVTALGRFLRASRIDELPQLINVLHGDMNIVGPRPERPSIVARLRHEISEYPLRLQAKPGITGWAQVNQSYDSCIDDVRAKVRYDLEYLQRQSLTEDLRIMLRTVPVMLLRVGGW
jgi:lipopolysaccharide/colanic/teichoic acid biosynthesis glycosyltransferase